MCHRNGPRSHSAPLLLVRHPNLAHSRPASQSYIRPICILVFCSRPVMDDAIPSISTAGVGSRFVSQDELEAAKARRDEQWRAAYARCICLYMNT